MDGISRRALLISKGWVQASLLVVLFGFFVLGLLAYRTYQAKPPTPDRVVDPQGRCSTPPRDVREGQQVFLHNGLMEYGSVFGHGAYLGPDYTADYLRRASDFVARTYGGAARTRAARRTIEDFRTNRYDEASGTLTLTAPQAEAHRRLVGHYSRFFSEPTTKHGLRKEAITDATRPAQLTAFFGWTAWAALDRAPGPRLLLHEQLAARAARGERADGERGRLERALADRAAGRHRDPVRRLRALAVPGLARARAGDAVVPRARRRRAHAGPAGDRLVLLRDGGAVPDPDLRRRRLAALPGGARRLLRLRPRPGLPVQPDAHVARAARAVLGGHVVRGGRDLPGADDRPARAQAPGQAGLRAARRARRRRVRHADRLVPGSPRRARGRRVELVRAAGLRVPGPRAALAGAALDRPVRVGVHALPRAAQAAAQRAPRQHAVAVLPGRAARSRRSTRSA